MNVRKSTRAPLIWFGLTFLLLFSWFALSAFAKIPRAFCPDQGNPEWNRPGDFDPLGRRLRTTTVPVTNGVALTTGSSTMGLVQDGFGNVVGRASHGVMSWNGARWSLFGPAEGYPGLSLGVGPADERAPGVARPVAGRDGALLLGCAPL